MAYSKTLELIEAIVTKLGGTMTGTNLSSTNDGLEQILALINTGGGSGPAIGTAVGAASKNQTLTDGENTINHDQNGRPIGVVVLDSTLTIPVIPDWSITDLNNIVIYWTGGTLTNARIILTF